MSANEGIPAELRGDDFSNNRPKADSSGFEAILEAVAQDPCY